MKVKEIIDVHNFISNLKLNKLDKDVRFKLIKIYPELVKNVKEYEDYRKNLQDKMFEDRQEEIDTIQELRNKLSTSRNIDEVLEINKEFENHKDFFKLEKEFSQLIAEYLSKDIVIDFEKLNKDSFIDSLYTSEIDFTLSDLSRLDSIFE